MNIKKLNENLKRVLNERNRTFDNLDYDSSDEIIYSTYGASVYIITKNDVYFVYSEDERGLTKEGKFKSYEDALEYIADDIINREDPYQIEEMMDMGDFDIYDEYVEKRIQSWIEDSQEDEELNEKLNGTLSEAKWGSYAEYSLPNGDRDDEVEETKVYRQGKTIDGKKWTETILDEKTVNILGKDVTYIKVFHKTEDADPDNFAQKDRYTWQIKNEDDLDDIGELLKSSVKSQLGVDDSKSVGASTMIGVPQSIEG